MNKKVPSKKVLHSKKKPSSRNSSSKANGEKRNNMRQTLFIILVTSIVVSVVTSVINKTDFSFMSNKTKNQSSESQNQPAPEINNPNTDQSQLTDKNTPKKTNSDDISTDQSNEKQSSENIDITLFFIRLSGDGNPVLIEMNRKITKTSAVLTTSIQSLLQGPNSQEQAENLLSYIPKGSILKKASVKNGVAFLDFNEEFQFNEYGNAGILAQLFQIVYTSTHLPNISSVQITIEGKRVSYLGGEGTIEVDKPITRAYLNNF